MASRGHSIPFIVPDEESGRFNVTPAALAFLSSIRTPVAPVAVVGKYRTGKSFLLNRLIKRSGAFEVGPTIEACTKGIWLWSEPLYSTAADGSEIALIFVDTEGIGAATATAEHDARIFSLATLLCSLLVYNSIGNIDEEAIQSLSFVANITKHIQLRSGAGAAEAAVKDGAALDEAASEESGSEPDSDADDSDADDSAGGSQAAYIAAMRKAQRKRRAAAKRALATRKREEAVRSAALRRGGDLDAGASTAVDEGEVSLFFPTFLWVLRDFTLDLLDDEGVRMSPLDYLESCLQPQNGFSSDAQARNRTRRVLLSFFKDRDCFTLVRPIDDEARLQTIDSIAESELRPEFRTAMKELRSLVTDKLIKPKTMQGAPVTGRMLGGLATAYVAAINAHAVPSIGNAWDGVTRVECKDALDAARKHFLDAMEAEAPKSALPMDDDDLRLIFERHRVAALDAYDGKAVGGSAAKYRQELKAAMDSEWRVIHAENATASEMSCTRLISRLWQHVVEAKCTPTLAASPLSGGPSAPATPSAGATVARVYSDYQAFAGDLERVHTSYWKEARGPHAHAALSKFLISAMPTVIRSINGARAAEEEARIADLTRSVVALRHDVEIATSRAAVFEAQCADMRKEREATALNRARAEVDVKVLREEHVRAQQRIEELLKEKAELQEKLRAERKEHANVRVAMAASGSLQSPARPGPSGHATTLSPSVGRVHSADIDLAAIVGGGKPSGAVNGGGATVAGKAAARTLQAAADPSLRMMPANAHDIAMPAHVDFPEPKAGGQCAPCVVQ